MKIGFISMNEISHEFIAGYLHSIGWSSTSDAQWTRLKNALPELSNLLLDNNKIYNDEIESYKNALNAATQEIKQAKDDETTAWKKVTELKYKLVELQDATESVIKDLERYKKLREMHFTDNKLCIVDRYTVKLGIQTYTKQLLDNKLDSY